PYCRSVGAPLQAQLRGLSLQENAPAAAPHDQLVAVERLQQIERVRERDGHFGIAHRRIALGRAVPGDQLDELPLSRAQLALSRACVLREERDVLRADRRTLRALTGDEQLKAEPRQLAERLQRHQDQI